jgi:hypothetical protein
LRPDRVAGVNARTGLSCGGFDPAQDLYLNSDAFVHAAPFTFGNAPRLLADARGCGWADESLSLMKYTQITERVQLRIGIDAFNIFNRNHFGDPSANIDNLNYGRISSAGPGRTMQLHAKIFW